MSAREAFGVSVKGVLLHEGRVLLRRNQRGEYELPGGRLERGDASPEERLIVEFREESGIEVEVLAHREPWLYEVGERNVLIVPYLCRALRVPDALFDEDGGTLHWLRPEEAEAAFMPQGYKDTIAGRIPHASASAPSGSYFKILPDYVDWRYAVEVCARGSGGELARGELPRGRSPREFILEKLGDESESAELIPEPVEIDQARGAVCVNYRVRREGK